jgi:thiamine transporter
MMNPESAPIISELFELKWYTVAILAAMVITGIMLYKAARTTRWNSRRIANAAMCIAIAYVLSCIKLYKMPQGGSITPASMLPLVMFSVACGPVQGFMAGCAYGLLELLQDPYIIHPIQMLVDYPLAFGFIALGGLVNFIPMHKAVKLPAAVLLGSIGRYAMAVLSGTVFFAEYAPVGQSALIYSLGYNLLYLGWDVFICAVIAALPGLYRITDIIRSNVQTRR